MTTTSPLQQEFQYYLDNQEELVKQHNGKVLVIKGTDVIGVYDDEALAIDETVKTEKLGTFLVQRCSPGATDYTATFNSRVAFS